MGVAYCGGCAVGVIETTVASIASKMSSRKIGDNIKEKKMDNFFEN